MNKVAALIIGIIVVILLAVGGFVFLAGQSEDDSAGSGPDTASAPQEADMNHDAAASNPAGTSPTGASDSGTRDTDTPQAAGDQDANYVIDMFNFGYSIKQIKAAPGDTLTIELTNSNGTHNFVIDELGVESDMINTGGRTLVTIKVPESAAGQTYEYYCSHSNHRALGMVGQLVISE